MEEISENFKIILEHHKRRFVFEAHWGIDINQAIEAFYGLLIADTYNVEDVKQAFLEFSEEINK